MNKSSKYNNSLELKTPTKESHNQGSELIAFIEFLARCAAEQDYKSLSAQTYKQIDNGEEDND